MSMMAYPSFLKAITGYLSWERRRGSRRERFSSRAATLAGHRGGAGCPRQCRPPHSGKSASRKRTSCDGERKGAMPPTTTISSAFLLPDAFSLDPYLAWFT